MNLIAGLGTEAQLEHAHILEHATYRVSVSRRTTRGMAEQESQDNQNTITVNVKSTRNKVQVTLSPGALVKEASCAYVCVSVL